MMMMMTLLSHIRFQRAGVLKSDKVCDLRNKDLIKFNRNCSSK